MINELNYHEHTVLDILRLGVDRFGPRTLLRHRLNDTWEDVSWDQFQEMVNALASFLIEFGLKPGDIISIYSENRPEWAVSDYATLSIGAVDAGIYPTNSAPEAAYIINDSKSSICFCGGKFQVDNLLSIKNEMPSLKKIIVFDDEEYDDEIVMNFSQALEKGRKNLKISEIKERSSKVTGDDLMTLIYSSGTTGNPKGVMLSHRNIMFICLTFNRQQMMPDKVKFLSLLPLCHAVERTMCYYSILAMGGNIAYCRGTDFFAEDLADIRPEAAIYVPRVFEKVYNGIMTKLADAPEKKQKIFAWALEKGKKAVPYLMANKRKPLGVAIPYKFADILIFSKLRKALGLDRCITWGAAGAPLAIDIHDFFWAMGVQARKGYGLTETSPVISVDGDPRHMPVKSDGWIAPFPETEVKIAPDGEILARGPQVMMGYLNKPEETKEMFTEDGFIMTGDIGILDDEGYLKITDRKKDIIVTAGGKNIAPQVIESRFLFHTFIEQMAVVGDGKKYISALIVPSFEALRPWAKENGISAESEEALVKDPKVIEKYNSIIEELNQEFGRVEQIKRFTLIPREFTQETGELTPTLKLKRKVVMKNYGELIDGMYTE